MKKLLASLVIVAVLGAAYVFAGSSGLSHSVTRYTQPRPGGDSTGLAAKQTTFNDDVVTWADTSEDRLDDIEAGTATITQETDTLLVGNASSNQVAMPVEGDVTITQDGTNVTTAIAAGAIVNADVNAAAGINYGKLKTATMVNHAQGTNGAVIALTYGVVNYISPVGGGDGDTNAITFAAASAADVNKIAYVVVDHDVGLSNTLSVAYGAPWYGPTLHLHRGDSLQVWAQETNVLRAVGGLLSGTATQPSP
jgi:hypothetical protein